MTRDKHKTRRRASIREWFVLVLAGLAAFWLLGVFHDKGISPKWLTAIMGTLFPFGALIYGHRHWLTRWTFWIAVLVSLVVHCILILAIFQYVLKRFTHFSPLLWAPIMIVEFLALLVVIAKIENALSGNRDRKTIRISF
jgi:peptidoglycan/LPS O-acetylase OafA/YrhL